MRNGGRTQDRVIHGVGWLMLFLIALGVYFGREVIVIIVWAVFS